MGKFLATGSFAHILDMEKVNQEDKRIYPDYVLISKALEVIGGKWRLYIILLLGKETRRYRDLNQLLPTVSDKVLAGELKALVALGVMERKAYAEIPPRVEYRLSQKGEQALPLLSQLQAVGQIFNHY